jgi:hypothetical protein
VSSWTSLSCHNTASHNTCQSANHLREVSTAVGISPYTPVFLDSSTKAEGGGDSRKRIRAGNSGPGHTLLPCSVIPPWPSPTAWPDTRLQVHRKGYFRCWCKAPVRLAAAAQKGRLYLMAATAPVKGARTKTPTTFLSR